MGKITEILSASDLCKFTETSIRTFLQKNNHYVNGLEIQVSVRDSPAFNAGACKGYNLIYFNRGVFEFLYAIISNFFKVPDFLGNLLDVCTDNAIIFKEVNFNSSDVFFNKQGIKFSSLRIDQILRRETANSIYNYCIIFSCLHEIGHLRQDTPEKDSFDPDMVSKVLEMDADLFAVLHFAENLKCQYKRNYFKESAIFSSKESLLYFIIFIFTFIYFIVNQTEINNKKQVRKEYPSAELRVRYSMKTLAKLFKKDNFLSENVINNIGIRVLDDFSHLIKKTFHNFDMKSYFYTNKSKEIYDEALAIESYVQKLNPASNYILNRHRDCGLVPLSQT